MDVAASSTFLNHPSTTTLLLSSSDDEASFLEDDDFDDEDDEEVEPGKMRVSEITAELKLRGVDYGDCFDKESLVVRLTEARETGKANPEILDKLNKSKVGRIVTHGQCFFLFCCGAHSHHSCLLCVCVCLSLLVGRDV